MTTFVRTENGVQTIVTSKDVSREVTAAQTADRKLVKTMSQDQGGKVSHITYRDGRVVTIRPATDEDLEVKAPSVREVVVLDVPALRVAPVAGGKVHFGNALRVAGGEILSPKCTFGGSGRTRFVQRPNSAKVTCGSCIAAHPNLV